MNKNILEGRSILKVFEDDRIVVLNKPAGVLILPDRYDKQALSLVRMLEAEYGEIFIVHRIDKDTSGLIVFAKDAEAHQMLNNQFMEHSITKIYHAVVRGLFNKENFEVDIPLLANPTGKAGTIPSARGKYALTIFNSLECFRLASLVECRIVTGRQHQIRVHAAVIGYPLLVDPLYTGVSEFYLSSIKKKFKLAKQESESPIIKRLTLHSYFMEFIHPDGNKIQLTADYPKDFEVLTKLLRKYA